MFSWYPKWINASYRKIAVGGILLGVVGLYFSVELYRNLHPDIEELLPESTRSVQDYATVSKRLKSVESYALLVYSENPEGSQKYVEALGERLKKIPSDIVSLVSYEIKNELAFFNKHAPLFIDVEDLATIRTFLEKRIAWEKKAGLGLFSSDDIGTKPTIDAEGLKKKYLSKGFGYKTSDGYYATPDKKIRVILAYMTGKGLEQAHRMKKEIDAAILDVDPKPYAPDIKLRFTGNVPNLIEESDALVDDLELSTIITVILEVLVLILFFRSVVGTIALTSALFLGVFWTFGVSYFLVSFLNANTAFLASIVIGNGVNFGIIYLARYLEERRRGAFPFEAVSIAARTTAVATVVAALAAGLSYGSLMVTQFRGFNQFGVIGLVGMVLCWIATYTLLPSFLLLLDKGVLKGGATQDENSTLFAAFGRLIDTHSRAICVVFVVVTMVSFVPFFTYKPGLIEMDMSKLKDKRSQTEGSGSLYHYLTEIFSRSPTPIAILAKSEQEALDIAKELRKKKDEQGDKSILAYVQTLSDYVPSRQQEKIPYVKAIQKVIHPSMLRALKEEERDWVKTFIGAKDIQPFVQADLPSGILDHFRETDGTMGKMVLLDRVATNIENAEKLNEFVTLLRETADKVSPDAAIAGELPILRDMIRSIQEDGPTTTLIAFGMVILLLVVQFRDVKTITYAVLALLLGVLWMDSLLLALKLKINFLNFIALPITFGIGADYGINIFQRFRLEGSDSILKVIRSSGGAVMLCSLTTIIGYGSLLFAGNQAFVSFGVLAIIGEITTLVAAIVVLPAALRLGAARQQKKTKIEEKEQQEEEVPPRSIAL